MRPDRPSSMKNIAFAFAILTLSTLFSARALAVDYTCKNNVQCVVLLGSDFSECVENKCTYAPCLKPTDCTRISPAQTCIANRCQKIPTCTTDLQCSDNLFCTGVERCRVGAPGADRRGCIKGSDPLGCSGTNTCSEATHRCEDTCPDRDGDGHQDGACGGDDCDDNNPTRYPGATEVCDLVDNDCNEMSLGEMDNDHDGHISMACCNPTPGTRDFRCGDDCDDNKGWIYPGIQMCDPLNPAAVLICGYAPGMCAPTDRCYVQPNGTGVCSKR